MILGNGIKFKTLYKLDRLLREVIVSTYLNKGMTDQSLNEVDETSNRIYSIAENIYSDQNIEIGDLKFIEILYKMYQPTIGVADVDMVIGFEFRR